ncbi:MAG: hypothetical protein GQ574_24290 [Crocinitomix sp.]|nr:hypothetical protein [Crocinitomix sp.]
MNRIENVTLTGGLIGLIGSSPLMSLNKAVKNYNSKGWRVVQVLPSNSGNIAILALRIALLILTLGLFTISNGYYLVLELKEGFTAEEFDDNVEGEDEFFFGSGHLKKDQNTNANTPQTNDNPTTTNSIFN